MQTKGTLVLTRALLAIMLTAAALFVLAVLPASAEIEVSVEKVERAKTVAPESDSVCSDYLCDDGTCVSNEIWCDVDFDFAVDTTAGAADSVCSEHLCPDGTCVSDAVWCDFDISSLPGAAAKCSADAPVRCGDGSCAAAAGQCEARAPAAEAGVDVESDTNVCDGVTCSDGSCAATQDECGVTGVGNSNAAARQANAQTADGVCNGYLCDDGTCTTSEAMCGILNEGAVMVTDGVCNGFVCDNGTCATSEAMCGLLEVGATAANATDSVCNGYTCDNGTCATSEAMCDVFASAAVEVRDTDSDGDGLDDGTVRANANANRAEEANVRAQNDVSAQPKLTENERGQDYNSSRSNKPNRAVFANSDQNERPEVAMRGGVFVRADSATGTTAARGEADGNVYCWGRAEDDEGQLYAWGRGICIASEATANASGTAQTRLAALQVRGDDVRSWNEEQQSAWQEFRASRATSSVEERLIERMVEKTKENARIQEITSDDNGVGMEYRAEMRLFGFIPMERTVNAQADSAGEVEVDYPWYRFLSRVPEQTTIEDILRDLQSMKVGGGGAGRVSL